MASRKNHIGTINRLIAMCGASVFVAVSIFAGVAIGEGHQFSGKSSLEIDPAGKQQLGEQAFNEVMMFFYAAEMAIEKKDLEAMMALYSDNYLDGDHDKKSAEQAWRRIFATFDTMAIIHSMKFEKASANKDMVVFRCNGLLLGATGTDKKLVTMDNWNKQDHILVKEEGKWKLIGTYGPERKRLWFDKPMHPLF